MHFNPLYGIKKDEPEFTIWYALIEGNAVCIDCNKERCDEQTHEEINLWRT